MSKSETNEVIIGASLEALKERFLSNLDETRRFSIIEKELKEKNYVIILQTTSSSRSAGEIITVELYEIGDKQTRVVVKSVLAALFQRSDKGINQENIDAIIPMLKAVPEKLS